MSLFLEILAVVCLFSSVWLSFLYRSSVAEHEISKLNLSPVPLRTPKVIPFERALHLRKG